MGPLPEEHSFNTIVTMTDHASMDVHLVPICTDLTVAKFASLFFDHWYYENGLLLEIVADQDKLFLF